MCNTAVYDRLRALLLGGALLTSVLVAAPAYAFPLYGVALSDSGWSGGIVMRVHRVGATGLVGRVRCVPGSAPCLSRRYRVGMTFAADGSFTGAMSSRHTQCTIAGDLFDSGLLQGRYACARDDGMQDVGSFQVTP